MAEVRFEPAWRRNDPKIAADAIALWQRLGALPANLDPTVRAKELCLAAYCDGELVGISTMVLKLCRTVSDSFAASLSPSTVSKTWPASLGSNRGRFWHNGRRPSAGEGARHGHHRRKSDA
jgi:hypothetical protein